jgi:hypothetical protein
MNLSDFIIIYLACGSPVAVWFYFNNKDTANVWSKSLFAGLGWIIFVFQFIQKSLSNQFQKPEKISDVRQIQKRIETMLPEQISIFEFREIFDRYIGLTLAEQDSLKDTLKLNNAFSAQFNSRNKEISAKCLQRVGRKKLKSHQTYSRKDFLQTIREISEQIVEPLEFLKLNLVFVTILNDHEAEVKVEEINSELLQIISVKSVKLKEVELWNNEKLKLPTIEQTNFHLTNTKPQIIRMTTKD